MTSTRNCVTSFQMLPFHPMISTLTSKIRVSAAPDASRQLTNLVSSGITVLDDQSWLLNTKGLFVFRDAYGNVLSDLVTEVTFNWKDIWMAEDTKTAELDIPRLPATAGEYVLELYFNGSFVTAFDITVTE